VQLRDKKGEKMKIDIELIPEEMTVEKMEVLEEAGLILRICPKHHELFVEDDQTKVEPLYISDPDFGSHQLITVTVNRSQPAAFGSHPDNEDVLLLGDPQSKPMWFIFSNQKRESLEEKIQTGSLCSNDFIAFKTKFNDPEISFFTILKDTPHGECTVALPGKPPSFYVTEPSNMPLNKIDFGTYQIKVRNDQ
jgi:hypothetical protein